MLHATTADRDASGDGEVISEDHQFGYSIHELCVSKTEGERLLEAEEGTSPLLRRRPRLGFLSWSKRPVRPGTRDRLRGHRTQVWDRHQRRRRPHDVTGGSFTPTLREATAVRSAPPRCCSWN